MLPKSNIIKVLTNSTDNAINLKQYFKDPDGDNLTYIMKVPSSDIVSASVEDDKLIINATNEGSVNLEISAYDNKGETVSGFFIIEVLTFWNYYMNEIIGVACIFLVILIIYLICKKSIKIFQDNNEQSHSVLKKALFQDSRFEGYFLNTKSGNNIPVLYWNASYIDNRHEVTLAELFSMMEMKERLTEAHKIHLEVAGNGKVFFYHYTNCAVRMGSNMILKGKKAVLDYDDKIYIVFEDGITELELRYKRVRKLIRE